MLKNKKLRIEEGKKAISNFELAEKEGRVFLWGGVEASVSFCGSAGLVLQIDIPSNPPVLVYSHQPPRPARKDFPASKTASAKVLRPDVPG